MTREIQPAGVTQTGNYKAWWVPEGGLEDPANPTLTELQAATVKPITYSLQKGGFTSSKETQRLKVERLTAPQSREKRGETTHGLELMIVHGTDGDDLLVEGVTGFIVTRPAVANATDLAVDQVVDVREITDVETFAMPPTGEGEFGRRIRPFLGEVYENRKIVA